MRITPANYNQTNNSRTAFGARIENLPYIAKWLDTYLNEGEAAKFLKQIDKKKNVIQSMGFEGDRNVSIAFDRFDKTKDRATFHIESTLPEERGYAEAEVIIPYKQNRGKHIANRLVNVIRKVINSIANNPDYLLFKSKTVQDAINNPRSQLEIEGKMLPKNSSTVKMPSVPHSKS